MDALCKAQTIYVDHIELLKTLTWLAIKCDRIPLLGWFFLFLLDEGLAEAHNSWDTVLSHASSVEAVEIDGQFKHWTVMHVRHDVESIWPEPRDIRLPSDLEQDDG